jgi:hypothetical protein
MPGKETHSGALAVFVQLIRADGTDAALTCKRLPGLLNQESNHRMQGQNEGDHCFANLTPNGNAA